MRSLFVLNLEETKYSKVKQATLPIKLLHEQ